MAKSRRRLFDTLGPFAARVEFTFNGVTFGVGERFPHEHLEKRRLRLLYDARRIEFDGGPDLMAEPVAEEKLTYDEVMAKAFELTGKRFRKIERAQEAIEAIEAAA